MFVLFVLLYSICCSIIEDLVCVFGVCFCCDISTEIPHLGPVEAAYDDDNILGKGVYERLTSAVCFFRDEGGEGNNSEPIGAGFAVSTTTVYSAAHNFADPQKDKQILCSFGKPHQHQTRRLKMKEFDKHLDYCIMETVLGEASLPNFLEISIDKPVAGKKCVLAAFQIRIQDLKHLDPHLSVGVFEGTIAKRYPRHFVYQCPSFAGDSGGAVVLKDGKVIGIHQETVIQARERIQRGEDLDDDARLESVEASIDELLKSLSSGSIGLQISAVSDPSRRSTK